MVPNFIIKAMHHGYPFATCLPTQASIYGQAI